MRDARGSGDADIEMAASSQAIGLPGDGNVADLPARTPILELAGRPTLPPDLDHLADGWQQALDAADRALRAADRSLPQAYLAQEKKELTVERKQTAAMLSRLAHVTGSLPEPWLSPVPLTTEMLGLPHGVAACLFDLDGVLTDSAVVHASAWGVVFDDFLQRLNEDRLALHPLYGEGLPHLHGRAPEARSDSRVPEQPRNSPA